MCYHWPSFSSKLISNRDCLKLYLSASFRCVNRDYHCNLGICTAVVGVQCCKRIKKWWNSPQLVTESLFLKHFPVLLSFTRDVKPQKQRHPLLIAGWKVLTFFDSLRHKTKSHIKLLHYGSFDSFTAEMIIWWGVDRTSSWTSKWKSCYSHCRITTVFCYS